MESSTSSLSLIVFEFFSGIGGMRDALSKISSISLKSVHAFDINPNANLTYQYNFSDKPYERTIESFTLKEYEDLIEKEKNEKSKILWTMSPPCQPFTRQGKEEGLNDNRSKAFLHLMNMLEKTKFKPDYFLLENVKNFETSKANEMLIKVLDSNKYNYLQFLLSPIQFNIPNSRLRFYCIARYEKFQNETKDIITSVDIFKDKIEEEKNIFDFLSFDKSKEKENSKYYVQKNILEKDSSRSMDIVTLENKSTNCFTKNYSRLFKGTGSLLLIDASLYKTNLDLKTLEKKLRFFTPEEILKFLCFSSSFEFPESLTVKSQYRLLGNSVNVKVVNVLLSHLLIIKN